MLSRHPLTLHIRLTHKCNADCSYCSSWQHESGRHMSVEQFSKALGWLIPHYMSLIGKPVHLTVEYVGGEILTIPLKELEAIVFSARSLFEKFKIPYIDGVQSNLISSSAKVDGLFELFGNRIGTSISRFSNERTLAGSPVHYLTVFRKNDRRISNVRNYSVPGVITVTPENIHNILREVIYCASEKRNITVRPVFQGGKRVQLISPEDLANLYTEIWDRWFLRHSIKIEPLFSLLHALRGGPNGYDPNYNTTFCPFQSDCSLKSVSLEPDGQLFVCQEMADAKMLPIGNALSKEFNEDLFFTLANRSSNLHPDCMACPYLKACQGGCMFEAYSHSFNYYSKPNNCSAWKALLKHMSNSINNTTDSEITSWLDSMGQILP